MAIVRTFLVCFDFSYTHHRIDCAGFDVRFDSLSVSLLDILLTS